MWNYSCSVYKYVATYQTYQLLRCFIFFTDPIYDPCLNVKCSQGEACVVTINEKKTDKVAQCQCISATDNCLESIHVCASDNTTYKSHCHMDAEACATRKRLTVLHYGECRFGKFTYRAVVCVYY